MQFDEWIKSKMNELTIEELESPGMDDSVRTINNYHRKNYGIAYSVYKQFIKEISQKSEIK